MASLAKNKYGHYALVKSKMTLSVLTITHFGLALLLCIEGWKRIKSETPPIENKYWIGVDIVVSLLFCLPYAILDITPNLLAIILIAVWIGFRLWNNPTYGRDNILSGKGYLDFVRDGVFIGAFYFMFGRFSSYDVTRTTFLMLATMLGTLGGILVRQNDIRRRKAYEEKKKLTL